MQKEDYVKHHKALKVILIFEPLKPYVLKKQVLGLL